METKITIETKKSIDFIEQPEELQALDMNMIRGGVSDALEGDDVPNCPQLTSCGCYGGKCSIRL